ncbi:uncharacterized protein LOC142051219 [Phalacrocorax aristotelis]|uniref:uncharacterized protein LOC142051219 n=1 Tax=Phalacrocorax aristotelis TaxID=126867 RepID=UPI003F4B12D1
MGPPEATEGVGHPRPGRGRAGRAPPLRRQRLLPPQHPHPVGGGPRPGPPRPHRARTNQGPGCLLGPQCPPIGGRGGRAGLRLRRETPRPAEPNHGHRRCRRRSRPDGDPHARDAGGAFVPPRLPPVAAILPSNPPLLPRALRAPRGQLDLHHLVGQRHRDVGGWGGRPADPAAVTTRAGDASGTRSWLRLSLRDWNGTAGVTCVARGGAQVTRQELSRKTGPLKPPTIHLLPSSPRDVCAGRDFTLFCLVADFYPPEVAAWWRTGASQGPPAEGPRCDHVTQRCSLVVAVDVPAGEWGRGVSYACSVAHISSGKTAEASVDIRADPWDCAGRHFVPCGLTGNGDDLEPEEDGGAWTTTSTFVALFLLLVFYSGFVTFLKVK